MYCVNFYFCTKKPPDLKHLLSVFLLSLFCFSIIRPVIPFFEYAFNYEFIAKILCINKKNAPLNCNGKCYLRAQLSSVHKQSESKEKQILHIDIDSLPKIVIAVHAIFLRSVQVLQKNKSYYFEKLSFNTYSKPLTPPPKFYLFLI